MKGHQRKLVHSWSMQALPLLTETDRTLPPGCITSPPPYVLGYHGCDREIGERLLQNEQFRPSENTYDWLGSGIYFWEANPDRALDWARERTERRKLLEDIQAEPFVVGAVLNLGFCLDLISANGSQAAENAMWV